MSYSISIQIKSEKLKHEFLKFLQENFRHWSVVCGENPTEWHGSASDPTDDLSYGATLTSIGFNYQSGMYGFERDYIYSVIRWMAIKVGDRKRQMLVEMTDKGTVIHQFIEPTPYYIYDGWEVLNPVLIVTKEQAEDLPKDKQNWTVDDWGVRVGSTAVDQLIGSCRGLFGEHQAPITEELKAITNGHPSDGKTDDKTWGEYRVIYLNHLSNEIDENVDLIRQEIQRLDKLWAGEV